ncbi:hypothetical protein ACWDA3_59235 [Nonomuraea rubra]
MGSTITVLLMAGLNHKLNQRRERWLTELAEAVEDLSLVSRVRLGPTFG